MFSRYRMADAFEGYRVIRSKRLGVLSTRFFVAMMLPRELDILSGIMEILSAYLCKSQQFSVSNGLFGRDERQVAVLDLALWILDAAFATLRPAKVGD